MFGNGIGDGDVWLEWPTGVLITQPTSHLPQHAEKYLPNDKGNQRPEMSACMRKIRREGQGRAVDTLTSTTLVQTGSALSPSLRSGPVFLADTNHSNFKLHSLSRCLMTVTNAYQLFFRTA